MSSSAASDQKAWRQSNSHTNRQNNARGGLQSRGSRNAQDNQSNTTPSNQGGFWTSGDKNRGGISGARGPTARNATSTAATSGAGTSTSPAPENPVVGTSVTHTPVRGFNASEVREFLKRVYQDATAGDLNRAAQWIPAGENPPSKANGPWGSKPSVMANGQDFWVQLKKQVAAKQQGNIGG